MAGALAPAADARVALKAVASIDRLIQTSAHDLFLNNVLKCAAEVLRSEAPNANHATKSSMAGRSSSLH